MKKSELTSRIRAYVFGFSLSLVTTIAAFALVTVPGTSTLPRWVVIGGILLLAFAQLMVQLVYFLHLGREPKPRLNGMAFAFMSMVVLIIGLGSLWVMHNLDYNMMPRDPKTHMEAEENINTKPSSHTNHH